MEGEVTLQGSEDDMTAKPVERAEPVEDRNALLEKALIKEYLQSKGFLLEEIRKLPKDIANKLMKEASQYASLKMEEVEARARFIEELKDDASPLD